MSREQRNNLINIAKSKRWKAVALAVMLVILGWILVQNIIHIDVITDSTELYMMIEGVYSTDGGAWVPIDSDQPITDRFHKIVFKGRMTEAASHFSNLDISSKDVWYRMTTISGKEILSYTERPDNVPGLSNRWVSQADRLPGTPGYCVKHFYIEDMNKDVVQGKTEVLLEVTFPYEVLSRSFSECFSVNIGNIDGYYSNFFIDVLPSVLLFALICFFGVFFFPVAGFILGKINYKYITFGALCLFWGLFMIAQSISGYLNMWVNDPVVCMITVRLTSYLFISAIFVYLKSNMERSITRAVGNIMLTVFLLTVIAAVVLHLTNTADLVTTTPSVFVVVSLCAVVMMAMLSIEVFQNRSVLVFLLSWIPLMLTLAFDIINKFLFFSEMQFFNIGLTITMMYQLVRLVLDLRKQYKETIRYQQLQKELYEAKVSVMVSQIQPHFMYNALSSIAMLCKINPDTAYHATVAFSDYLRGNMESLKRQIPVSFSKELEHVKKYLYIEQLRFGKKLQIAYDIQVTDFVLPQLSIQPLVENAVKHGVGMRKNGGTVIIATYERENAFEVTIADDGVGFDTQQHKEDERSHVGMENTRRRIREMCGGEVKIKSTIGEGTVATVILPKEGQCNENTVR